MATTTNTLAERVKGNFPPEVLRVFPQLSDAVDVTMDPLASKERRVQAYLFCEYFKETSPVCAECGVYMLGSRQLSPSTQRFGLQLMEHCIKHRWDTMTRREVMYIRRHAMRLVRSGAGVEVRLRDGLARLLAELAKREWPQTWDSFPEDTFRECRSGAGASEIVCRAWGRLVEDVAILQTVEWPGRSRELQAVLRAESARVLEFFASLVQYNTPGDNTSRPEGDARVARAALEVLSACATWAPVAHIMACGVVATLCTLLEAEGGGCRGAAADCLTQIVSRKGSTEERQPLAAVFAVEHMGCILRVVETAATQPPQQHLHLFLKQLAQLLTGMGALLCALWPPESGTAAAVLAPLPPGLPHYLDAVLALCGHPSLEVAHAGVGAWQRLCRHRGEALGEALGEKAPQWVAAVAPRLVKVGYPSGRDGGNSAASAYARLDCLSDAEHDAVLCECRADVLEAVRDCAAHTPHVAFAYAAQWLEERGQKEGGGFARLEWEALALFVESVMSQVCTARPRPDAAHCLRLLDLCLAFSPSDPLQLAAVLACMQALFPLGTARAARVLLKVLAALAAGFTQQYTAGEVKQLRRKAVNVVLHLARNHGTLFTPMLQQLRTTVTSLAREPTGLSCAEVSVLTEAVIVVAQCAGQQDRAVADATREVAVRWRTVAPALEGVKEFAAFVGLDRPPGAEGKEACDLNRWGLLRCVHLLEAVVRGSAAPLSPPTASLLLRLLHALHALHTPEGGRALQGGYGPQALHMADRDKSSLLATGKAPSPTPTPLSRMQHFLSSCHDISCAVLGSCGLVLAGSVPEAVLCGGPCAMPDHWLRVVLRQLATPLVRSGPGQMGGELMAALCPFMLDRLEARWGGGEGRRDCAQEVLDDILNRVITRDYLELLRLALLGSNGGGGPDKSLPQPLSPRGVSLLRAPACSMSLVQSLLRALGWPDTVSCLHAAALVAACTEQLAEDGMMNAECACHVVTCVLRGLHAHGMHAEARHALVMLGVRVYATLRPAFPSVRQVLLTVPGCDESDLARFDARFLPTQTTAKSGRARREAFARLTAPLTGVSPGQMYRRRLPAPALPRLAGLGEKPKGVKRVAQGVGGEAVQTKTIKR